MSNDISELKEQLSDQWQKVAIDLIRKGIPADMVFESLLTVGLAGHVELHGKDLTAGKLVAIAEQLSEQVRAREGSPSGSVRRHKKLDRQRTLTLIRLTTNAPPKLRSRHFPCATSRVIVALAHATNIFFSAQQPQWGRILMQPALDSTIMDRLAALGRKQGHLTNPDLPANLPVDAMSAEEIALIVVHLEEAGIPVELDDSPYAPNPKAGPAPVKSCGDNSLPGPRRGVAHEAEDRDAPEQRCVPGGCVQSIRPEGRGALGCRRIRPPSCLCCLALSSCFSASDPAGQAYQSSARASSIVGSGFTAGPVKCVTLSCSLDRAEKPRSRKAVLGSNRDFTAAAASYPMMASGPGTTLGAGAETIASRASEAGSGTSALAS